MITGGGMAGGRPRGGMVGFPMSAAGPWLGTNEGSPTRMGRVFRTEGARVRRQGGPRNPGRCHDYISAGGENIFFDETSWEIY